MYDQDEDPFATSSIESLHLADSISESFSLSNFDGSSRFYLPELRLHQLVTLEAIVSELCRFTEFLYTVKSDSRERFRETYDKDTLRDFAEWILSSAHRTFAIMVHCDINPLQLLASMQKCRDIEFTDANLPVLDPGTLPTFWNKTIWSISKSKDFCEKQWRFLVPVFSPDDYRYDRQYNCIFPFTKANVAPRVGAFSTVHKVTIHPDHQKDNRMRTVSNPA